jgi:hypothetical protein
MKEFSRELACVSLAFSALFGCSRTPAPQESGERPRDSAAIVVRGSELSGNLLEGLRSRIPTMTVSTPTGECPRIVFRGPRSIRNQGNPTVYVDGTLMRDTCVLYQMSATDIDYVEIYPSGIASHPGVQRNPFGLILVYRLRG